MAFICLRCKTKSLIKLSSGLCINCSRKETFFKVNKTLTKTEFQSSSPAPFVGRYNYPNINLGVLTPTEQEEETWMYDAPNYWAAQNMQIPKIVNFRSRLINSRTKANVKKIDKLVEVVQEIGLASKPVDLEVNLFDKPKFKLNLDSHVAPTGPNAALKKIRITTNPKIHQKIDKATSDMDLKAGEAITHLYNKGFDENFLSKVLSVGSLGVKEQRKLVPTRWSITATDNTIANKILEQVKYFDESNFLCYYGDYLGNYYLILLMPGMWTYELFEMFTPTKTNVWSKKKLNYATDYEGFNGRKNYAEETAGGYYAAKLPIVEKLKKIKRQANVLALRFITEEYETPLGVWVVREAIRKALSNNPLEFGSKELLLKYAQALVKKKFGYDISDIIGKSLLLKNYQKQKLLKSFL